MTQQDKLLIIINENLEKIKNKLLSYKKVDATLSENTLFNVAVGLDFIDQQLEKNFIKDACNEIDLNYKLN